MFVSPRVGDRFGADATNGVVDVCRFNLDCLESVRIPAEHFGVFRRRKVLADLQGASGIENIRDAQESFCCEPFPLPTFAGALPECQHLSFFQRAPFVCDSRDAIVRFYLNTGVILPCLPIICIGNDVADGVRDVVPVMLGDTPGACKGDVFSRFAGLPFSFREPFADSDRAFGIVRHGDDFVEFFSFHARVFVIQFSMFRRG